MIENPFKVGDKVRQKPRGQQRLFSGADLGYSDFLGNAIFKIHKIEPGYVHINEGGPKFQQVWCHERFELVESVEREPLPKEDGEIVWVLFNPLLKKIDSICSTRAVARSRKSPDQRVKKAKITIIGD